MTVGTLVIREQKPGSRPCGAGASSPPPALAMSLPQRDVQARWGEGVAALLRLDQVPGTQDKVTKES